MADYQSQFTGQQIDQRLAAVTDKQDRLVSGENIKTVGGQSILGSGDIPIQPGDTDAVKYVSQDLTAAQKAQARANIDAASLEDIQDMDFVTATERPTASASTMGHIYLIGPDANNNYERYYTQKSNGTYSWVPLGSTQLNLSTYATKDEVSQLEAKVDSLPRGKDYGFYTSSDNLPNDATEEGFAYVGATEPYAIWQFDGTTWTDSGVTANAFTANAGQVQDSVDNYLEEHPTITGTFNNAAKRALVSLLRKVAFIDTHGQDYIDELEDELFMSEIDHIEAVFTQGGNVIYDFYSLDKLREYLVVTAFYTDGTSEVVNSYLLSGSLESGTSTITVTFEDATDTFSVTVTGTVKLYMDGNEYSSLTGGWQTKGFNLTNASPRKVKQDDGLLLIFDSASTNAAAASFSTTNQIDLTGLTKVFFEVEAHSDSGGGSSYCYWTATLSEATTQSGAYGNDYSSNRNWIGDPVDMVAGETVLIERTIGTSRTSAYVSINLNLYAKNGIGFSAGSYIKIKKVCLV